MNTNTQIDKIDKVLSKISGKEMKGFVRQYAAMLDFTSRTTYYLSSTPTEMRNGRESLAVIIREKMQHDSYSYDEAPEDNAFQ